MDVSALFLDLAGRTDTCKSVYLFASILAFDPWHMLTSFVPYMLLSPTYINVLNMYAAYTSQHL